MRLLVMLIFLICTFWVALATDHPHILIWDNDVDGSFPNPDNASESIGTEVHVRDALLANGYSDITLTQTLPTNLSLFTVVFVLDGFFPYTGTITDAEQQILADYLVNKDGRLYIEGGDFGYNYRNGALFSNLGAIFRSDGFFYQHGNVHHAIGEENTFSNGLFFVYPGYQSNLSDNYLDEIDIDPTTTSQLLFNSDTPVLYTNGRCIAYTNTVGTHTYHSIYSTFLFSGLQNGTGNNTRNHLMSLYMDYFNWQVNVEPTSLGNIRALYH